MSKAIQDYKDYKKLFVVDEGEGNFKGTIPMPVAYFCRDLCLEYDLELNLKFVRIYFDVTTFDKITKDRAAKFVDMLSAIGGTMGLLTGFSIISGVEILFFATRIIHQFLKNFAKSAQ